MYYLVESWDRTMMDVLYFRVGYGPREDKWCIRGRYQTHGDAWAAYHTLIEKAITEMSSMSSERWQ